MNAELLSVIDSLKAQGFEFIPEDVSDFETTGLPAGLLPFYRDYGAPSGESEFQMIELAAILVELEAMPGQTLAPLGIIPVAQDLSGTPLCIDTTTFRSPSEGGEIYLFEIGDYSGMSHDEALSGATLKATSFADLLAKLPNLEY